LFLKQPDNGSPKFDLRSITVRAGKGNKDRATRLPDALIPQLRNHLTKVAQLHKTDLLQESGYAPMPNALYRKHPSASQSLRWQFVFPSSQVRPWRDTRWRALKRAVGQARIMKHVGPHTLRHSFASHLLSAGIDIRTIQTLLGHRNIETTMIYTHISPDHKHVRSPLDQMRNGLCLLSGVRPPHCPGERPVSGKFYECHFRVDSGPWLTL